MSRGVLWDFYEGPNTRVTPDGGFTCTTKIDNEAKTVWFHSQTSTDFLEIERLDTEEIRRIDLIVVVRLRWGKMHADQFAHAIFNSRDPNAWRNNETRHQTPN